MLRKDQQAATEVGEQQHGAEGKEQQQAAEGKEQQLGAEGMNESLEASPLPPSLHCLHYMSYPGLERYSILFLQCDNENTPPAKPAKYAKTDAPPTKRVKCTGIDAKKLTMTKRQTNYVNHINQDKTICVESYKCY